MLAGTCRAKQGSGSPVAHRCRAAHGPATPDILPGCPAPEAGIGSTWGGRVGWSAETGVLPLFIQLANSREAPAGTACRPSATGRANAGEARLNLWPTWVWTAHWARRPVRGLTGAVPRNALARGRWARKCHVLEAWQPASPILPSYAVLSVCWVDGGEPSPQPAPKMTSRLVLRLLVVQRSCLTLRVRFAFAGVTNHQIRISNGSQWVGAQSHFGPGFPSSLGLESLHLPRFGILVARARCGGSSGAR